MKVKVELRCSVVRRNEDEEIARGLKGARRDGRTERMKLMAAATATSVALMALAAAAVEGSFPCPAEDVTFELVTGHVFRSPDDILGRAPFFLPSSVIFSDQFNQYWLNLNKLCSITKTMFPPVSPQNVEEVLEPLSRPRTRGPACCTSRIASPDAAGTSPASRSTTRPGCASCSTLRPSSSRVSTQLIEGGNSPMERESFSLHN